MIHRFDAAPHPDARARNRRARRMERARLRILERARSMRVRERCPASRAMAPPTSRCRSVCYQDDARAPLEHIEETVRDGGSRGAVERRRACRARRGRSGCRCTCGVARLADVARVLLDDPCQ